VEIDLLNFSNITPNEVLTMLGGVFDSLTALLSSQFMQVNIPFTDINLSDVLDYARSFKEEVLDPLFVSGNFLQPDYDGDGAVTFGVDLNFRSIQGLVEQLADNLGISDLVSYYDPDVNELSFTIDFFRAFGLGQGKVKTTTQGVEGTTAEVQQLTFPVASISVARPEGATDDSVQILTITNAAGGKYSLTGTARPARPSSTTPRSMPSRLP
jgi:hypothetical protein